jgi:hypothetical protein
VAGIGLDGDPNPINHWDLGVANSTELLSPVYSLLHVPYAGADGTNLVGQDPMVIEEYTSTVQVFPWRGNPNFIGATIVALDLPPNLLGDYHLAPGSPAIDAGIGSNDGVPAPNQDYDGQPRPVNAVFDIGADETPWPYPLTNILFPPAPAAQAPAAAAPQQIDPEYNFYLPLVVVTNGNAPTAWDGQVNSFVFDVESGVTVRESGVVYWKAASFDQNQEVYLTFTEVAAEATRQDLLLKATGLMVDGAFGPDARLIDVHYDTVAGQVSVRTLSPGGQWQIHQMWGGIHFAAGDRFGARATVGGLVEIYQNDELIGRADLTDTAEGTIVPWPYSAEGGNVGVWFEGPDFAGEAGASFTDFGGGTLP